MLFALRRTERQSQAEQSEGEDADGKSNEDHDTCCRDERDDCVIVTRYAYARTRYDVCQNRVLTGRGRTKDVSS